MFRRAWQCRSIEFRRAVDLWPTVKAMKLSAVDCCWFNLGVGFSFKVLRLDCCSACRECIVHLPLIRAAAASLETRRPPLASLARSLAWLLTAASSPGTARRPLARPPATCSRLSSCLCSTEYANQQQRALNVAKLFFIVCNLVGSRADSVWYEDPPSLVADVTRANTLIYKLVSDKYQNIIVEATTLHAYYMITHAGTVVRYKYWYYEIVGQKCLMLLNSSPPVYQLHG